MFPIIAYIKFLLTSFSKKNLVSNTSLNSIKRVLQKKTNPKKIEQFNKYKLQLLQNKNTINVTDFGAGSRVFKSNKRRVCDIAKHVGINKKHAKILINLVEDSQPKTVLEIGTSVGLGTAALAIGNPNTNIISLEGCPETASVAQQNLKTNKLSAKIIVGNFSKTLPKIVNDNKFDIIYFDGNHQKEATLAYFKQCLPCINENSIFIFDDIHWSKSMQDAWNEIKSHTKVTMTIDTYQWGIVFFNTKEKKENYSLRL